MLRMCGECRPRGPCIIIKACKECRACKAISQLRLLKTCALRDKRGKTAVYLQFFFLVKQMSCVFQSKSFPSIIQLQMKKALLSENILDFIPTCERAFCAMVKNISCNYRCLSQRHASRENLTLKFYLSFSASFPCLLKFLSRLLAAATSSVFLFRTFCCWFVWSSNSLIFCCCFCISFSILLFLSASSLSFFCSWSCWFLILSMCTSNSWTFFSLSSCNALIFSLSWEKKNIFFVFGASNRLLYAIA